MFGSPSDPAFVTVTAGLVIPLQPYLLLLELQRRGYTLTQEDDDALVIQPGRGLTRKDRNRICLWKPHLLVLINCDGSESVQ